MSALQLLGELTVLPAILDARQRVTHSGLDPRQHRSGTSVEVPRLSKLGNRHLRRALYMPALVASQCAMFNAPGIASSRAIPRGNQHTR